MCRFPSLGGIACRGPEKERAPDNGRPVGTVSQSGYPQAMWTTAPMLWRTRRNLCTTRWTAL
ncbi:protein of unknown function [Streptomyces murinus]